MLLQTLMHRSTLLRILHSILAQSCPANRLLPRPPGRSQLGEVAHHHHHLSREPQLMTLTESQGPIAAGLPRAAQMNRCVCDSASCASRLHHDGCIMGRRLCSEGLSLMIEGLFREHTSLARLTLVLGWMWVCNREVGPREVLLWARPRISYSSCTWRCCCSACVWCSPSAASCHTVHGGGSWVCQCCRTATR